MQELQRDRIGMSTTNPKFDESKLLPEQRKAYELAKAQGVKPIRSMEQLKLDIEPDELEQFADALDAQRAQSRLDKPKNKV